MDRLHTRHTGTRRGLLHSVHLHLWKYILGNYWLGLLAGNADGYVLVPQIHRPTGKTNRSPSKRQSIKN